MKTVIALALCTWFCFTTPSLSAQQVPNDQQIMIIIVIGNGQIGGSGAFMMRLSYPSPESCKEAAKIMEQDTKGGFVTARCLSTH
jgi:hypothetical protein